MMTTAPLQTVLSNVTRTTEDIHQLSDDSIHELLTSALGRIFQHIDLTFDEMYQVMLIIMQGRCSDAMMGAILTGLRMKGESIDEITASASAMRALAANIAPKDCRYMVDIVGTGGDGANLFNVSTAAALVAAAAGAQVAKHGNRGVSTKSGSSDLLEQAGISLSLTPEQAQACIEEQGIGFLFAPNHHSAMRYANPVRRELKSRTIFNILGPLTNPAGTPNLVIGVFTAQLCEPLAKVMKNLGARHVMVVGAKDGLDEISLATSTTVAELKDGEISVYEMMPEDAGIESQTLIGLDVDSPAQSLELIRAALSGVETHDRAVLKARDMIALNAGAAIYTAGLASNYPNGVSHAQKIIQNGDALVKLESLAHYTQQLAAQN
ncbi:anthranilate phosphoribosyltransferase [Psychrobacter arcticus 273-4]|uniref:Anthranilate phosphoribosyltransferase n=1 Tax=Psychrobacter arcticus (strain DSM 17307 / VKM B-2377 / 273-4) TaxID=259536 RepID=Q4FT32_PSYA2|nr:anthranilate phosphoribosyltransferase [Psychrobacter arcticus]AAZ18826.1 anthranilate phosphoribosyltransferase [Psychrobacter arcticus 273-4]